MQEQITLIPQSTITCPNCAHVSTETMPTNVCQFFWECPFCGKVIRPLDGDCCVFCSYGDVPCPPVQMSKLGGTGNTCCNARDLFC